VANFGKVLAIDYGKKRIGLAISDSQRKVAVPHKILNLTGILEQDVNMVVEVIQEIKPTKLVVGLPVSTDGTLNESALGVKSFVELLSKSLDVDYEYFDERYSTKIASALKIDKKQKAKKNILDSSAAAIILQSWLDYNNGKSNKNLMDKDYV
jgi:putative Holliday junction resolvase